MSVERRVRGSRADLCRECWLTGNAPLAPGPIVGEGPSEGSRSPRAVVPEYFYEVCQDRALIRSDEVNGALTDPSAETLIQTWAEKTAAHRCVEVVASPPEIFDEQ